MKHSRELYSSGCQCKVVDIFTILIAFMSVILHVKTKE